MSLPPACEKRFLGCLPKRQKGSWKACGLRSRAIFLSGMNFASFCSRCAAAFRRAARRDPSWNTNSSAGLFQGISLALTCRRFFPKRQGITNF